MKLNILLVFVAICLGLLLRSLIGPNSNTGIPYVKANWEQIQLVNNSSSHDPSWDELRTFLADDKTEGIPYSDSSFICGDYAEMLHNNAEKMGIKAAVVIIHSVGDNITHAINTFNTTDEGLVYVDDTAGQNSYKDKLAYVVEGREYGLIGLDEADSPNYDFYINYVEEWEAGIAPYFYPSVRTVSAIEIFW